MLSTMLRSMSVDQASPRPVRSRRLRFQLSGGHLAQAVALQQNWHLHLRAAVPPRTGRNTNQTVLL
jgi:hypothetical protein